MPLKRIVFFAFLAISVAVINNLVQSTYSLWQKKDLIVKAKQELSHEKKENAELKKKLAAANDPQFIEQEARNKLFLARPGEGVIVLPSEVLSATVEAKPKNHSQPNWKKWLELFF